MSLTLVLTKHQQTVALLSDEEAEEFNALSDDEKYDYLDPWFSDMDTIERTIEEV